MKPISLATMADVEEKNGVYFLRLFTEEGLRSVRINFNKLVELGNQIDDIITEAERKQGDIRQGNTLG